MTIAENKKKHKIRRNRSWRINDVKDFCRERTPEELQKDKENKAARLQRITEEAFKMKISLIGI